eukprot:11885267-Alexandrium_andersonii.AAC.1
MRWKTSAAAASRRTAGCAGKVALGAGGRTAAPAELEPVLAAADDGAAMGWLLALPPPAAGRRKPDLSC